MVRKFDEPILQDVLILMDCSRPPPGAIPRRKRISGTPCWKPPPPCLPPRAAQITSSAFRCWAPIRWTWINVWACPFALDYLSRVDFSETDRFERVLAMESRRLRKVGCVVVIAARLNIPMIDIMIRMHRMGPSLRLYLVTFAPEDENVLPLIARLQQSGIEVSYVTPERLSETDRFCH